MDKFPAWYNANKNSDVLNEEYQQYLTEYKQMGIKTIGFRAWARERYLELLSN